MSLHLDSVSVTLGGNVILDQVSLAVEPGERVAVMGPSGTGKSTLLRVAAGLVTPNAGSVNVDDIDYTTSPPHQRPIGLMFQDYALFPHMDVRSNVAYGLRMQDVGRADAMAAADDLLELVGLIEHRDRLPGNLSGGEQQRVALARSLAPRPSVVLLDEPLGSLDQDLKEDLLVEMVRIVEELGISSLYVTHDRDEATRFGSRIAIMRDGRIVRVDTAEALWAQPRTAFVARFMGHRSIVPGITIGFEAASVAVPPEAVTIVGSGGIPGIVTRSVFEAGRYRITTALGGTSVETFSNEPHAPGTGLALAFDPDRLIALSDD